jgi:1-acyl-sn-glycerol-3-phosphate acyltransferase
MSHVLRVLFFGLVVRPLLLVMLGLNVRRREQLPEQGPAVLIANHNSHLDALVLMCLFPLRRLPQVRPVAARDYFLKNRFLAWFAQKIIGIIPIDRAVRGGSGDILAEVAEAIRRGDIVIVFPEGSRGQPEHIGAFKTGVAHLARRFPALPFYPVFLHGLGKALPRGEALLVPFFCDVFIGAPLTWTGDRTRFMQTLLERMEALVAEGNFPPWD